MTTDLPSLAVALPSPELAQVAAELVDNAIPVNTVRAYRGQRDRYVAWTESADRDPWDPAVAEDYLASEYRRGLGPQSLRQTATMLRKAWGSEHRAPPARWSALIAGAEAALVAAGRAHVREAPPLRLDDWRAVMRALYRRTVYIDWQRDARDRAILAIGYLGALRRSEVVALDRTDIAESDEGLTVTLRGTKTSRRREQTAALPRGEDPATCPVRAWTDWLAARPCSLAIDADDPAWLACARTGRITFERLGGDHAIERILRRALDLAAIADSHTYTAHSLRAGLATELAEHGIAMSQIANAGRWTGLDTVLRYARRAHQWTDSPLHALHY